MAKIMKKITWTWKKVVSIILGLLGIGTLTSCYGMPIQDPYYNPEGVNVVFKGIVKGDIDGDGETEPVPGIKILSNYSKTLSNTNGKFEILAYFPDDGEPCYLYFTDVDGEKNGAFKQSLISKDKPIDYNPDPQNDDFTWIDVDGSIINNPYSGVIDIGTITLDKE